MKRTRIIVLTLLGAALFFFFQCERSVKTAKQNRIQLTDQADSSQYYSYRLNFPDTLHYANLAKAIKNYAFASRDSFFAMMPEDTASLRFPWQLIVDTGKTSESPRFVAFSADYYRFTGGAHGVSATKTFVYDKEKKQLIKLKDLFSDTTAIESISQYAKGAVARKVYEVESLQNVDLPMQDWVKEGTAPAFSNFETFLPAQAAPEGITG